MMAIELGPNALHKWPISMHAVITGDRLPFFMNMCGGGFTIRSMGAKTIQIHDDVRDQLPNYRQRLELSPEPTPQ